MYIKHTQGLKWWSHHVYKKIPVIPSEHSVSERFTTFGHRSPAQLMFKTLAYEGQPIRRAWRRGVKGAAPSSSTRLIRVILTCESGKATLQKSKRNRSPLRIWEESVSKEKNCNHAKMEKKKHVFHRQAFYISEKIKYPPLSSVPQLNINKFLILITPLDSCCKPLTSCQTSLCCIQNFGSKRIFLLINQLLHGCDPLPLNMSLRTLGDSRSRLGKQTYCFLNV